jgi:hypothetical protein
LSSGEYASANAAFRAGSTVGAVLPTFLNSTQYCTAKRSKASSAHFPAFSADSQAQHTTHPHSAFGIPGIAVITQSHQTADNTSSSAAVKVTLTDGTELYHAVAFG